MTRIIGRQTVALVILLPLQRYKKDNVYKSHTYSLTSAFFIHLVNHVDLHVITMSYPSRDRLPVNELIDKSFLTCILATPGNKIESATLALPNDGLLRQV